MSQKILRPYQVDAIAAVQESFQKYSSTLIVLPTGMGKTFVAAKIMMGWEKGNSLFLAHTKELIGQTAQTLAAEMGGVMPVVEMNVQGAENRDIYQGGMVVVGSVQSMYMEKRLRKYRNHPFGLILVDEAHRATSSTYTRVINFFREKNPNLKVIGLTATPNRSDGTSLGLQFESCAYQTSINLAIDDGWLVPIQQKSVMIDNVDFSKLKIKKNAFGDKDFSDEEVEKIFVEEESLQAYARAILDMSEGRSTLIFTPGVKSAHLLASILNRYEPGSTAAADGETDTKEREGIVELFRSGALKRLCNACLYIEGFDAPTCSCLAMCRPTRSLGRYVQMLGRGLRPLPGVVDGISDTFDRKTSIFTSDKRDCLVLDFAGNSRHQLVSVWDALGGVYDQETRELAEQHGDKKNISEDMEKAKHLRILMNQWNDRQKVLADRVDYRSYDTNPFAGARPASASPQPPRGGATEPQVNLLIKLGVAHEAARGYSKGQAGAIIDKLAATKCTDGQKKVLDRYGIPHEGLGMDAASKLLDAIAHNKWQPFPSHIVQQLIHEFTGGRLGRAS